MDQKPPVNLEQEHQSNPPEEQHHHEAQQKQRSTPPAAKVARLVPPRRGEAGTVTMATPSSPLVALGLHLGQHGAAGDVARLPAFTFMQRQELEHQAVIYKYMAAGLPVPVHLVLPIWKSVVASSLGPRHFPTLMSYYGSLCLDYRNYMEPEPGRCRRTDGKKWRCSRDVVVDHKYCERHMHRGRNRSRKPVEAAAAAPAADATAPRGAATSSAKAASTAATGVSPPA